MAPNLGLDRITEAARSGPRPVVPPSAADTHGRPDHPVPPLLELHFVPRCEGHWRRPDSGDPVDPVTPQVPPIIDDEEH